MQTPIPILDPLFEEPTDGTIVTGDLVMLTSKDATNIVDRMGFEGQRQADGPHIGMLADMMVNGEFSPGSQITFAIDAAGAPHLVDGQHRLLAAARAEWDGLWHVRVMWGDTQDATGVYALLDGTQKKRPPAVIGKALGLTGIGEKMQAVCISSARYQNTWRSDYALPQSCKVPPIRDNISRAKEFLPQLADAERVLGAVNISTPARRKLMSSMVLAVIVETLAGAPEEAMSFWRSVGSNGDGIAGQLRDTLIEGKPTKASQYYNARLAAHAWNQRKSDQKLRRDNNKVLQVESTTLEIPV